jgi:hypothetical protein
MMVARKTGGFDLFYDHQNSDFCTEIQFAPLRSYLRSACGS